MAPPCTAAIARHILDAMNLELSTPEHNATDIEDEQLVPLQRTSTPVARGGSFAHADQEPVPPALPPAVRNALLGVVGVTLLCIVGLIVYSIAETKEAV